MGYEDAAPPPPQDDAPDPGTVTRSVDIEAPADKVWEAVADPDQRALWLDDDDARSRTTTPADIDPGRSVSWTWWHPGDESSPSHVEITVAPAGDGASRVTVTEQLVAPTSIMRASLLTHTGGSTTPSRTWDRRLLGLELLFLTAGVGVCLA